jgi:glycogen(starch) synthase
MTRIVHLSWEYPPRVFGGLGRHVQALAEAQVRLGHDVTVLTAATDGAPAVETVNGVTVRRIDRDPPDVPFDVDHLMLWGFGLETAIARVAVEEGLAADVVHAHDWHLVHAAAAIRASTGAPFVLTIHATEAGRHRGWVTSDLSRQIFQLEWWGAREADVLITCSRAMEVEVGTLFGATNVDVIPNGVDVQELPSGSRGREIVYLGRLEWEKGVQTLVEALALLRSRGVDFTAVLCGRGTFEPRLRDLVADEHLGDIVRFEGWISEEEKRAMLRSAGAAVVPSFYEPFGIVALEAVEAGAPIVVSDVGGLSEIAASVPGSMTFPAGDAQALAGTLSAMLDASHDPVAARAVLTEMYSWDGIAKGSLKAYARASRRMSAEGYQVPPEDRSVLA